MAFLEHAMRLYLSARLGYPAATGAEFVVPAQAILFGYMFTEHVGLWVFSEHSWHTWNRVRATPARTSEVMVAKAVHWGLYLLGQFTVLFVAGGVVFGLEISGSLPALVVLMFVTMLTAMAFGFCGIAVCPSQSAFDAWTYGGALVMAALGGAITHVLLLPGWARDVAPASPIYWSMRGARDVILGSGGFGDIAMPCAVLGAFTAGFALLGWWRFDPAVTKIGRTK
jgi:ABC-2 type transport system permease protein